MRRVLFFLTALLLTPSLAFAAIAFDTTATAGTVDQPTNASLTWTFTNTGATDYINICTWDTNPWTTSKMTATVNGVAATLVATGTTNSPTNDQLVVFSFAATQTAQQIVASSNAGAVDTLIGANASSYSGVSKTGASSTAVSTALTSTTTSLGVGTNSWTTLCTRWSGNAVVAGAGSTKREPTGASNEAYLFDSNGAVSGNTSMTITQAGGASTVGTVIVELVATVAAVAAKALNQTILFGF